MNGKFPKLATDNLDLRQIVDSDLGQIFKGLSHPDIKKYYGISFDSLEATKEQMTWFADLEQQDKGIWWAVCSIISGEFIGAIGLNDLNKVHKKAEIGFWLLPVHWGKGILAEIMTPVTNYAFKDLGLHRLEAYVETKNMNCKKALSKQKFSFEGTMIDYEVKNGNFVSMDIYAKIAEG